MLIKSCFVLFFMLVTLTKATADCNPAVPETTPDSDFTLHNDGTVTHHPTGLMWMRCLLGQTWDGTTCSGSAQAYTWQNALQAASGYAFAGYGDWRLPNVKELASIVEEACSNPSINTSAFPNARASLVWSSSAVADLSNFAWFVHFHDGMVTGIDKPTHFPHVRLVRGDEPIKPFTVVIDFKLNPPFNGVPGVIRGGLSLLESVTTTVHVSLYNGSTLLGSTNYYWTEGNGTGWALTSSEGEGTFCGFSSVDFTSIRDGSINGRFEITSDIPFEFDPAFSASTIDLTNCNGTSIVGTGTITSISVNGTIVGPIGGGVM